VHRIECQTFYEQNEHISLSSYKFL
jgi:hypothetical protein